MGTSRLCSSLDREGRVGRGSDGRREVPRSMSTSRKGSELESAWWCLVSRESGAGSESTAIDFPRTVGDISMEELGYTRVDLE